MIAAAQRTGHARTAWVSAAAIALLVVAVLLSLGVGARPIVPATVLDALLRFDPSDNDHVVVVTQRLPRTIIGLLAGIALALAGTVMQGLTRNPFADPGLLGVNAGASVGVLLAITLAGITRPSGFVWFAFGGAAIAAVAVALIGSRGPDGSAPAKLALTGAAITAGLTSLTLLVLTTQSAALDVYRYWSVGALNARGLDSVVLVFGPIVIGVVLALVSARGLDLIALGDETATGLGHSVGRTRTVGVLASVLLAGGATAIAGPVVFLGLVVPHALRAIVGGSYGRLLWIGMPLGAALLLFADVIGRVVAPPGEVQAGVVIAFIGAPVLIALVLRGQKVTL
ncbi:iron ABC transporter permease [Microbacterium sp. 2FI]|uniref:FecCD family ABC transporter permease n=1 Tax=Microbacterium sp. 2FI TaxID=2502193 RepID=UPI0010F7E9BB|nr:iron ABC transporter permease [Microbacterium sp. 2FI]